MRSLKLAVAALSLAGLASAQTAAAAERIGSPVAAGEQLGGENSTEALVAIFGVLGTLVVLLGATDVIGLFGEDDDRPASP